MTRSTLGRWGAFYAALGIGCATLPPTPPAGSDPPPRPPRAVPELPIVEPMRGLGLDFTMGLSARLPRNSDVFSTFSVTSALGLLLAGARGQTAQELQAALANRADPDLQQHLADTRAAVLADVASGGGTFTLASRVFLQRGATVNEDFARTADKYYGAGVQPVDFRGDHEAARVDINRWVGEATNGRIPELLPAGQPDERTSVVLANALYLHAAWDTPFDLAKTKSMPFSTSDGHSVQVMTMQGALHGMYAETPRFTAMDLPFRSDHRRIPLALLILLPKATTHVPPVAADIRDCLKHSREYDIDLSLPRFRVSASLDLVDALSKVGMPTAFGPGADYSGIPAGGISMFLHAATVDVDERGVDGAAGTAVAMGLAFHPVPRITVAVDRTFYFAVRDGESGAVLFSGRFDGPRS